MSEIKNLFIATVLSVLVLLGWQSFYEPKNSKGPLVQEYMNKNISNTDEKLNVENNNNNIKTKNLQKNSKLENKINIKNYLIPIENSHVIGDFSKQGLIFSKLFLKNYHEEISKDSPEVTILDKKNNFYAEIGFLPDENNIIDLPNKATIWEADGGKITPENPLTLSWINSQGMKFIVKISLDNDYLFKIEKKVLNINQNEEIIISLARSANRQTYARTYTWNKYGQRIEKNEKT